MRDHHTGSAHILPTPEASGLQDPFHVVECVLNLLFPVILVEIAVLVPAALTGELGCVAYDDCLGVMEGVAQVLASAWSVEVLEGRHYVFTGCRVKFKSGVMRLGLCSRRPIEGILWQGRFVSRCP